MRTSAEGVFAPRCAQFEVLEDRVVLSAAPLVDHFARSPLALPPAPELQYEQVATAADSLAQGGVSAARTAYGFTGKGQTVAVIDTGIANDHYALGHGYGAGRRVVGGWDFAENDANPYDDGPAGFHGTHVAGIIGSTDSRYSGVAPGVDLVALRVFDDMGNGNFTWVENALKWVHQNRNTFANPITTVNLSIGTNWNASSVPNWAMLEDEFAQLKADGIFISVAAGNSFGTFRTPGVSYPAASPHVVPVASVGESGLLSSFSQRNSRVIAAPGERIMSSVPDFLFGGDGNPNDFMSASGTSMATPYMAGASALLRQAMQFAGVGNVTQDALYTTLYNTSDLVFDTATNASYHRLNLERAINSVMPADDYGSTATAASSLGNLSGERTLVGLIGRLDDRDFFQFTAGASGTVRFSAQASSELVSQWTTAAGGTASGGSFTFDVVAGQTYSVGLGTNGGLGRYTLTAKLTPAAQAEVPPTDWGTVDARRVSGQNMSAGDAWFKVTASRSGIFTVEANFSQARGNIDLELYNADKQLLATSATGGHERIDAAATAGQTFYLRVRGANASVDFRLTNLVSASAKQVDVYGTAGGDVFTFVAGVRPSVTVNGVSYEFGGASTVFNFHGGAGSDSIHFAGTSAKENALVRVGNVQFSGKSFAAQGRDIETVVIASGGGGDTARLDDSAGNDTLAAGPASATLRGSGFSHTVSGFTGVAAYASAGHDVATFADSAGNDRFVAYSSHSYLVGSGFNNYAAGFDAVSAASTGGVDRAELYGTKGNDFLTRTALDARLSGAGYSNTAVGFASLRSVGGGGVDEAVFRDIGAGEYFYGRNNSARLSRAGLDQQIFDFAHVTATAREGATPRADVKAVDYIFTQVGTWR